MRGGVRDRGASADFCSGRGIPCRGKRAGSLADPPQYDGEKKAAEEGGEDKECEEGKRLWQTEGEKRTAAEGDDKHRAGIVDKAKEKVGLSPVQEALLVLSCDQSGSGRIAAQETGEEKNALSGGLRQTVAEQSDGDKEGKQSGNQLAQPEGDSIVASRQGGPRKEQQKGQ